MSADPNRFVVHPAPPSTPSTPSQPPPASDPKRFVVHHVPNMPSIPEAESDSEYSLVGSDPDVEDVNPEFDPGDEGPAGPFEFPDNELDPEKQVPVEVVHVKPDLQPGQKGDGSGGYAKRDSKGLDGGWRDEGEAPQRYYAKYPTGRGTDRVTAPTDLSTPLLCASGVLRGLRDREEGASQIRQGRLELLLHRKAQLQERWESIRQACERAHQDDNWRVGDQVIVLIQTAGTVPIMTGSIGVITSFSTRTNRKFATIVRVLKVRKQEVITSLSRQGLAKMPEKWHYIAADWNQVVNDTPENRALLLDIMSVANEIHNMTKHIYITTAFNHQEAQARIQDLESENATLRAENQLHVLQNTARGTQATDVSTSTDALQSHFATQSLTTGALPPADVNELLLTTWNLLQEARARIRDLEADNKDKSNHISFLMRANNTLYNENASLQKQLLNKRPRPK